jgi:replicative DNA helicase
MNRPLRQADAYMTPLHGEDDERAVIAACLKDTALFWQLNGKVQTNHFTVPRLARIWEAMVTLGNNGQNVARENIPRAIKGEEKSDTPLMVFLGLLMRGAPDSAIAVDIADKLVFNAGRRQFLDRIEEMRSMVLRADFGESMESLTEKGISAITSIGGSGFDRHMRSYGEWAQQVYERTLSNYEQGGDNVVGMDTGIGAVTEVMGRLLPERLYVLGGMSSSGKSALARQIVEAAAEQAQTQGLGWWYVASLEMAGDEHATRALSQRLGLAASKIEEGTIDLDSIERMRDWVDVLKRYQIILDVKPRMRMEDIRNRALRLKHQRGLAGIAVDHLLLIKPEGKAESMMDRVANGTSEAKFMARELGVPVLMLAQLNEKAIVERPSGRPHSGDLFGGQAIQQNADVVAFVHRQEIVERKREPSKEDSSKHAKWSSMIADLKGKAVIFNDKRRGGERHTEKRLVFHGETMTFGDA